MNEQSAKNGSVLNGFPKLVQRRPESMRIELLLNRLSSARTSYIQPAEGCQQVHLGFRRLTYHYRGGFFKTRRRKLLKEISGDFHAGELTAIMGPSGSGKSTLMNILAGYTTENIEGELLVNDREREEDSFRKNSCYIMQDDNLQPLLTVMEAMYVAANLKLSSDIKTKDKRERIKEILESIGLWDTRKVRTSSLSGGQRKRLAIALELLRNPQVMFFDEPTSGLDSASTKQCIMLLKQLAQEGRTVICTIHQPSAMVFEMFDHLYTISEGKCIYQGSIKGLLPFLEQTELYCPPYHNPADFLLEVANGEYGRYVEILTDLSENGMSSEHRRIIRDTLQIHSMEHIDEMMRSGLVTPVGPPPPFRFSELMALAEDKSSTCFSSNYTTTFYYQFYVLIRRSFLILSRDKTLTYNRIATHALIALFIGILYYGIGEDASNVLNNFNFMFFTCMFLMLTAFNCVTTTFPSEMPIIIREHFNRWYSLRAYYLAITLSDIPIQIAATTIYALITYFMTAQPINSYRVMLFLVMCILISIVSQSYGLVIGALMDVKNGVIFGPFCFLPFTIFSGFFVQLNNAHPYTRWVFHISFLKYGFEGLVLSIFGYDRGKLPCNAEYCHYVYPETFMDEVDMEDAQYSTSVIFLLSLVLFLRVLAYFVLYVQVGRQR